MRRKITPGRGGYAAVDNGAKKGPPPKGPGAGGCARRRGQAYPSVPVFPVVKSDQPPPAKWGPHDDIVKDLLCELFWCNNNCPGFYEWGDVTEYDPEYGEYTLRCSGCGKRLTIRLLMELEVA